MNNREKLYELTKKLSENQLASIVRIVERYIHMSSDAIDDLYCEKLTEDAAKDINKSTISIDALAKGLGFNVKDFQN